MQKGWQIKSTPLYVSSIALFLLILFTSCEQQKAKWTGTIEEADGVIVVKNPKEPMYPGDVLSLEEDLVLGREEKEEYLFVRITLDVDKYENMYVLDSRNSNIRVYDKNGIYVKTIGKRGEGPGEMVGPRGIQITPQNEIMVNNSYRRRLPFFLLSGEYLRQITLTEIPPSPKLKVDSNGDFIVKHTIRDAIFREALRKFNSAQEHIFTIAEVETNPGVFYFRFLSGLLFDVTEANNIVFGVNKNYELRIINEKGQLIRRIFKEYDPVVVREEEKKIMLEKDKISHERDVKFPKYYHPIADISVDEDGKIFVRTNEKAEIENSFYYDIFSSEGKYIARISLKTLVNIPLVWKKNKLYSVEEDEEGFQVVKRYKVEWKI
jgi:hypothetical protein